MDQLFKWAAENAVLFSLIGVVLAFILGANKNKVKMFGFTISQYVRKLFGRKLEQALENTIDAISEGLKSDNDKEGP
jgi:hypothetical protein